MSDDFTWRIFDYMKAIEAIWKWSLKRPNTKDLLEEAVPVRPPCEGKCERHLFSPSIPVHVARRYHRCVTDATERQEGQDASVMLASTIVTTFVVFWEWAMPVPPALEEQVSHARTLILPRAGGCTDVWKAQGH